jgi:hypothetical protein
MAPPIYPAENIDEDLCAAHPSVNYTTLDATVVACDDVPRVRMKYPR